MDLVLISDAKNPILKNFTDVAIASAGSSINIIVVESNPKITYQNVITIHPKTPFNYNAYLNIGANCGTSDYIFFGNNDLVFIENWELNLISEMISYKVVSASPISPISYNHNSPKINTGSYFGYEIIEKFCGWAFTWKRDFYEKAGGLDESFIFWCSDNCVIEQLKLFNEKHLLVTSSLVQHLGNGTIKTLDRNLIHEYTINEIERFNKKFNKNLWTQSHLRNLKS